MPSRGRDVARRRAQDAGVRAYEPALGGDEGSLGENVQRLKTPVRERVPEHTEEAKNCRGRAATRSVRRGRRPRSTARRPRRALNASTCLSTTCLGSAIRPYLLSVAVRRILPLSPARAISPGACGPPARGLHAALHEFEVAGASWLGSRPKWWSSPCRAGAPAPAAAAAAAIRRDHIAVRQHLCVGAIRHDREAVRLGCGVLAESSSTWPQLRIRQSSRRICSLSSPSPASSAAPAPRARGWCTDQPRDLRSASRIPAL